MAKKTEIGNKTQFAYCNVCKQDVENPRRLPLTGIQKVLWVMVTVATIGIAAIVFAIYYSGKPKNYCPDCHKKLLYSDKPFEKQKKKRADMTPREKVFDKAGLEEEGETKKPAKKVKTKKEKVEKKIFCSFCGEELDKDYPTCPFCQTALKS